MIPHRAWILGAFGALVLALAGLRAAAAAPQDDVAGVPAPENDPPAAALSDLRGDPAAWLGREVRLIVQRERELDAWQPFLSRFGPGDFAGFRAWGDGAFLWERAAFLDPAPRLFARRGGAAARVLQAGQPYDRFAVRAVVREVFQAEPWIEVLDARRLPEKVGEGAILHASRGLELLAEGSRDLARDQLQRARAGLIPAHAALELDRLIATCDAPPPR